MDVVQNLDDSTDCMLIEDGELPDSDNSIPTCAPEPATEPSEPQKNKKSKKLPKKKKSHKERVTQDIVDNPPIKPKKTIEIVEPVLEPQMAGKATVEVEIIKEPEVMGEDERDARTLFVGNVAEKVTDELLYELMVQAGPIEEINIPKDRETKKQKSFGFVLYKHKCAVEYACKIFEGTRLYGRELRLKNRNREGATAGGGGGLEALARGFHQSQAAQMRNSIDANCGIMNNRMMLNSPIMMNNPMFSGPMLQHPALMANMMPQTFQNLNAMNPFANFGQYPSQNQSNGGQRSGNNGGGSSNWADRSRNDWTSNRHHNNKPYDRNTRDRDRDWRNRDRHGGGGGRNRSGSRERRRSRSRSRDGNRYRGRR